MEIKEGMYVRAQIQDNVYILKIFKMEKSSIFIDKIIRDGCGDLHNAIEKYNIQKSSYSIIDVLQEGDYVNGEYIYDADWINDNGDYEEGLAFPIYDEEDRDVIVNWQPLKTEDIKSIVTEEQFKSMEYKVWLK